MALWNAGQARLARERRDRMAEDFRVARDAQLDVAVTTGQAKPIGTWKLPPYARPERPEGVVRSPETRDRTLARLNALIPGIVRTH